MTRIYKRYRANAAKILASSAAALFLSATAGLSAVAFAADGNVCLRSNAGTHNIAVEFATTAEARSRGLMMRESIADDAGMLFVYEQMGQRSFWMYKTLIPLDIAYINDAGEILDIQQMEPCQSYWSNRCPSYPAAAPFKYALEVNLGKFSEWGFAVGDRLLASDCETNIEEAQPWRS